MNSVETIRDVENILKELGLTNAESKKIISIIKNNDTSIEDNHRDDGSSGSNRDDEDRIINELQKKIDDIEVKNLEYKINKLVL